MNKNNFLPDRPIDFNRDFVKLGIGIKGALMLTQAVYWSKRTKDKEGWFPRTVEEWQEETGLTYEEQKSARKRLSKFLKCKLQGVPAKNYFKVGEQALLEGIKNTHE